MSKELEALANVKREAGTPYFSALYDIDMWNEDWVTIEKALKAFEIIRKNPNLVIAVMSNCKDGKEYNLLKEVLL